MDWEIPSHRDHRGGLATGALLLSTGPKIVKKSSKVSDMNFWGNSFTKWGICYGIYIFLNLYIIGFGPNPYQW